MADPSSPSTDPASLRLPWPIQAAAVLGIAVPIGMLAHLWHRDQQALASEVEGLKEEQVAIASDRDLLAAEASHFAAEAEKLAAEAEHLVEENTKLLGAREQLDLARAQLAAERDRSTDLERQVVGLNKRVAVLGQREESLLGIIDLLEGEVASAERRLEKLAEAQPQVAPEFRHLTAAAIVASSDPQLRRENARLRNELQKHDEQVVELLAEISTLNQEIEIVREQGTRHRVGNNGGATGPSSLAAVPDEAFLVEE